MEYIKTALVDVWIIEPKVFRDERGYFFEAYKKEEFEQQIGKIDFIQENESYSTKGVLRGLHYQRPPYSQSKLVRVMQGRVLDVAVDLRRDSPTYGESLAVELTAENKRQMFIPKGFAHGFYVLSEVALFTYKVDEPYMPTHEAGILFDDPSIGVDWGITEGSELIVSSKDRQLPLLEEITAPFLYQQQ